MAEIPGVDPTKIELSINGNLLILRGVKEIGELPEARLQGFRERRFGTFLRQVMVSGDVDFDAAQADAKNGVLTVRITKAPGGPAADHSDPSKLILQRWIGAPGSQA